MKGGVVLGKESSDLSENGLCELLEDATDNNFDIGAKCGMFWTEGGCHLGGSAVGFSSVVTNGLRLGDVFCGLIVHAVGVFIVVFFSFFVLRFGFGFRVRVIFLMHSLVGEGEREAMAVWGARVWQGCW